MRSSAATGAFIIRYFTPRPAMTASIIVRSSITVAATWGSGCRGPTRMAWLERRDPTERRPFMTSVEPDDTRSTMPSARPSRGATSTAPLIVTTSTGTPSRSNDSRVARGWLVASRRPASASRLVAGESTGTAASNRQYPNPSSSWTSRSAPLSMSRFVPVMPRSATPSATNSVMSSVRTKRMSSGKSDDTRRERARPVLEREPGVVEELDRRLLQPTLVRDREP